ncbi:3094_t:CDS:2 [Paraglomus occultum]|uniref:3094_t:CDS:1 n=1 Tax=Paraglomus occultum TaxID=144539 RepID=A0A9N9A6Q2_9GLOM|nr:3094_t:CDS:2 [Paraglomus occultum]
MSNSTTTLATNSNETVDDVAELVHNFDWASTPLGPMDSWPRWLKFVTNLCLNTAYPMVLYIGEDRIFIYNQMWVPLIQANHPCIGTSATLTYPEARDFLVPLFNAALRGEGKYIEDFCPYVIRSGYKEEAYFTWTLSPIYTDTGEIGGLISLATETTEKVLTNRRLKMFRDLANGTQGNY